MASNTTKVGFSKNQFKNEDEIRQEILKMNISEEQKKTCEAILDMNISKEQKELLISVYLLHGVTPEDGLKGMWEDRHKHLLRHLRTAYDRDTLRFALRDAPELEVIFNPGVAKGGFGGKGKGKGKGNGGGGNKGKAVTTTILPLDDKYFLIIGEMQEGKTKRIQCICLAHVVHTPCSVLVLLDNSVDGSTQIKDRSETFVEEHRAFAEGEGQTIEYLYVGKAKEEELVDAFSGKTKKMIVGLANAHQMKKITKALDQVDTPKFACCIDEADAIVCGDEGAAFRAQIPKVLEKAGRVYAVTATSFDLLFTQEQLDSANVIVMQQSGIYKGIRQIQKHNLSDKAVAANGRNPLWENDYQLQDYLSFYADKNVYGRHLGPSSTQPMPIISLIKNSHLNSKQEELAQLIQEDEVLGKTWSTVIYNGKGVTISHPGVTRMEIKGIKGVKKETGISFPSLSIKHALQYFYDLREQGGHVSHIAMISGDLADRGISFVSENYKWHINHMYYIPAKSASVSSLLQAAGRLCGKFDDDVPLILHAPKWVNAEIINGIEIQKEAIDRARKRGGMITVNIKDSMTFDVEKLPKKKLGREKVAKFEKATVSKPDDGWSVGVYREGHGKVEKPVWEENPKEREKPKEIPEEEFKRLTEKMFPKWAKASSTIAKFMQELDPEKVYKEEDILEYVSRIIDVTEPLTLTKGKRKTYGMIMKQVSDGYQMYPELVSVFKHYF